jgi:RHS repeat-associated protein
VNVYNASGQVTTQSDPMGYVTTLSYSGLDLMTGNGTVNVTDPDANTTVYDYELGALGAESKWSGAVGSTLVSSSTFGPSLTDSGASPGTLLDAWSTNGDVTSNGTPEVTTYTYDSLANETSQVAPLGDTTTNAYTSLDAVDCTTTSEAGTTCISLSPPAPVPPGTSSTPLQLTPPSVPGPGITYSLTDTTGNELYATTGIGTPGGSSSYARTTYTLYNYDSVKFATGTVVSCTTLAPSPSLPCATVGADANTSNLPASVTNYVTQLAYNSAGDLNSSSTPDGNGSEIAETTYSHDGDGEQTAVVAPDGNLSGANADNFTTATVYDADGEVTSVTEAGGTGGSGPTVTPRMKYDYYDANGNRTSTKDPRGYTTTYGFNADDEQSLVTDPDTNATLTCYDGDGNVTITVPPVGVAANSLTASSCPTSYPSSYGNRLGATDATTYTYDGAGNKTAMTTPAPAGQSGYETTTYSYDSAGSLLETVAPSTANSGPTDDTYNTYNSDGELATSTTAYGTTDASTTSYCYDPNGDTTAVVAPDGYATPVASCETSSPWVVNSTSWPTQAAYQTTSTYDSAGELASTTTPATSAASSGITTSYVFDAQGNTLTSTDELGVVTTYTYTPTNLASEVSYSSKAPTVTDTYDADRNKVAMSDGTGSSSYVFDPFGELTSADNGAGQTVAYTYNADGEVTGVTYPLPSGTSWASTDTVGYGYDNADLLTSVTDFNGNSIAISDTADSLPYSETLGSSGDTISTTYDPTDSPSAINLKSGSTTLLGFSYSDAPSGAILAETDTPTSLQSPADYTYTAQSRVASMTPGAGLTLTYHFDASGALTKLPAGATGTYDDAGELTSSVFSGTTTNYASDADGERLSAVQGSTTIASGAWNGAGELTSYSVGAAGISAAAYDGNGLRASDTSTQWGAQSFVWNTTSSVPDLLMDSTNAYIFAGSGTPAEQVNLSSGTIEYLAADSLGSVRGVVTSSGSKAASVNYDSWGNPETSGGLSSYTPLGFAGAYTDASGIIYLIGRYYDPATGQFLSVDPKLNQSNEPYEYADGDPVSLTDPDGTIWRYWISAGEAEAWGAALEATGKATKIIADNPEVDDVVSLLAAEVSRVAYSVATGLCECASRVQSNYPSRFPTHACGVWIYTININLLFYDAHIPYGIAIVLRYYRGSHLKHTTRDDLEDERINYTNILT